MRAAGPALLALTLAAPLVALSAAPLAANPLERPEPASRPRIGEPLAIIPPREAEESAARQAAFDRRITERSNRAARSICSGCGAGAATGSAVTPPGLDGRRQDEAMPRDPAQAPLD